MPGPALDRLLPRPKQGRRTGETLELPERPRILTGTGNPVVGAVAAELARVLSRHGMRPEPAEESTAAPHFRLSLDPGAGLGAQGYRLELAASGATLTGGDEAGLYYAVSTLRQWLGLHPPSAADGAARRFEGLEVVDRPDFAHRGVLLDVSRNKVPRLETLLALVDRLAGWKINQLQLYVEYTFAYRGHETVWRGASPLTADDVRRLDRHCRDRFVELVPNQNSFGHFHRWLRHPAYRHLAECPDGVRHPFGEAVEPFSLCPGDPGSLELLADLYDQLLPQFTSRQFNVGLDETFDLGEGRSAELCARHGREEVYLDFLRRVHKLVLERGRRMQFWADIVLRRPELVPRLPADAIPLVWGYEAGHPFGEAIEPLAAAGLDLYVCPGTSSWNSLAGRSANALENLAGAAAAGSRGGASGYLVTDWGDNGHLQPLPVSYLGFLAGAELGWNAGAGDAPAPPEVAEALDRHAFDGEAPGLGRITLELGDAHLGSGARPKNGTALFFLLLRPGDPLDHPRYRGLEAAGLAGARERIEALRSAIPPPAPDAADPLPPRELAWVAAMLELACRLGEARLEGGGCLLAELPRRLRRQAARELERLTAEHRELWLTRNRPGGLADSTALLDRLRDELV